MQLRGPLLIYAVLGSKCSAPIFASSYVLPSVLSNSSLAGANLTPDLPSRTAYNLEAASHACSFVARFLAMSHIAWIASWRSAPTSPRSMRARMFSMIAGRGRPFTKTLFTASAHHLSYLHRKAHHRGPRKTQPTHISTPGTYLHTPCSDLQASASPPQRLAAAALAPCGSARCRPSSRRGVGASTVSLTA
jgi:hypothetical protein